VELGVPSSGGVVAEPTSALEEDEQQHERDQLSPDAEE
jgi:hypothetical protein